MNLEKQLQALKKNSSKIQLAAESWDKPWKTLISTIMSARTRDEVTIPIAEKLFSNYPSLEKLSKSNIKDIQSIIKPINFYKNKSKNIINCSKDLIKNFKGKVPENIDKLITLPGVGRKTANVFLSEQGKDAIGVDTHVSYISQKLGWTKNNKPEKIEKDLENLFPKKDWKIVNSTLVRFGKTHTSKKKKDEILEKIKKM